MSNDVLWYQPYTMDLICSNCGIRAGNHSRFFATCPESNNSLDYNIRNTIFAQKGLFRAKRIKSSPGIKQGWIYDIVEVIKDPKHYCDQYFLQKDGVLFDADKFEIINEPKSNILEPIQNIADWKAWRHSAPGDCVCGTRREVCIYHR